MNVHLIVHLADQRVPGRRCGRIVAVNILLLALALQGSLAHAVEPAAATPAAAGRAWKLVVLGVAQDGGLPHLGCMQKRCVDARAGKRRREKVSCLGLTDGERGYLFDATPDLPAQWHMLPRVDGIFLTHAHIGHYTGLMYLGKEALAAKEVPVYGTKRMVDFLGANGPWSLLVKDRNIVTETMTSNGPVQENILVPNSFRAAKMGVGIRATTVPHREEFTDTLLYEIRGPRKTAIFLPDIDKWDTWGWGIREVVDRVDYVFLDGTFLSGDELPGRDISKVRHPFVTETIAKLKGTKTQVYFIHLNHTNPLWDDPSPVEREGFHVATEGLELPL